jgi:hypothetical protein
MNLCLFGAAERRQILATAVRPWEKILNRMSRSAAKDSFAPAGAHAHNDWNHGLACGFALSRSRFAQPWLRSAAAPRLIFTGCRLLLHSPAHCLRFLQ